MEYKRQAVSVAVAILVDLAHDSVQKRRVQEQREPDINIARLNPLELTLCPRSPTSSTNPSVL